MAKRTEAPRTYRVRAWKRQGIDMTWDRYQDMVEEREGKCDICLRKPRKRALCVDHNHKSGRIRGLLCDYCNGKVLRYIRDNDKLAEGLRLYLDRYYGDTE